MNSFVERPRKLQQHFSDEGEKSPLQYLFCRYLISQNAEAEAKVAAELDRLGLLATSERPQPRSLEYADVAKMVYLQAAIKVQFLHS